MNAILQQIHGTGLEVLVSYSLAYLFAQAIKILRVAFQRKQLKFMLLFATGGMPSSHSSTVTATATSIGLIDGFSSTMFALAACFAIVVMSDAAGLRRNAGKHATMLNRLVAELLSPESLLNGEKLKEFLGHTPLEVFAGAALGVAIAIALNLGLAML